MKKKLRSLFTIIISSTIFLSCTDESETISFQTENLNDKQKLLHETSVLLGKILLNSDVKTALHKEMNEVDEDGEIVSFAYLFKQEKGMRKNEISSFSKKRINSSNIFKKALQKEYESNKVNYKAIVNSLETKSSDGALAKSVEKIADELAKLLVSEELQIFYPYDPEYEDDDTRVQDYYVSFDPLNNAQKNVGYKFRSGLSEVEKVEDMTNDFLDDNPVYVIVPIDDCDIPGRPCSFKELLPAPVNPINNQLLPSINNNPTKLLTENTSHNTIPQSDVLSSYIPRIQINGTSWMAFAGTHQKLRFFRGTADGISITQNPNGTITAGGNKYIVKDFTVRRKYIKRDKKWLDFNAEFDPDWDASENTQVIAIFSLHKLKAEASFEMTAKSGFKIENGKIVPSYEASGDVKIKVTVGSAKFRHNVEISRRMVLITNVGEGTTGRTILDNGVAYNVKTMGIVDYYFKHYHSKL